MSILRMISSRREPAPSEPGEMLSAMESALSLMLAEQPVLRSDMKRAEIEAERKLIDGEEAHYLALIEYHEKEIEAARRQLADLALCRDVNDASAAILNAGRVIDLRAAAAEEYDLDAEGQPEAEKAA